MSEEKDLTIEETIAVLRQGAKAYKAFEFGIEAGKHLLTIKQVEKEALANIDDLGLQIKNQEKLLEAAKANVRDYKEQAAEEAKAAALEVEKQAKAAADKFASDKAGYSSTISDLSSRVDGLGKDVISLSNEKADLEKEIAALKEEKAKALENITRQFA